MAAELKVLRDDPTSLNRLSTTALVQELWVQGFPDRWSALKSPSSLRPNPPYQFLDTGLLIWKSLPLNEGLSPKTVWGSTLIPFESFYLWKKILKVDFFFTAIEDSRILFTTLTDAYGDPLTGPAPFLTDGHNPELLTTPLPEDPGILFTVLDQDPYEGDQFSLNTLFLFTVSWFGAASLGLFLLLQFLLRPLQNLRQGIQRILQDYESGAQAFHPIPINSRNEIGAAAQAFNHVGEELFNLLHKMNSLNQALFESNRLKDEILSNTSHELRTPLNGIISASQLLLSENLSPHQTEHLRLISEAGHRLQTTIDALLDYSEAVKSPGPKTTLDFSLREMVVPLWDSILPLARKKRLLTTVDIPSLPRIHGHPDRIRKALVQILDNSFKFTPQGYVCLTANLQKSMVHLVIADTGVGIPKESLEKVFQPFTQGWTGLNRPYGGLGLGLSLAKELIEQSGGKIAVQSEVGQGTTLTITLPVAQNSELEPEYHFSNRNHQPAAEPHPSGEPVQRSSQPVSILIVDDEPSNLYLLTRLVRQMGYDAVPAEGGPQALQRIYSGWRPTLILLDIMMPDMDGLEVTRKLREDFSLMEMPIVLFSAKSQSTDIIQGFEAGANDYLVKPLNREELQARLRPHVEMKLQSDIQKTFVPQEIIDLIHDSTHTPPFLGDSKDLTSTIMVFRLSSLPQTEEESPSADGIHLLNSFFLRMGPVIRGGGGRILEYRRDGFTALFPPEPDGAIKTGLLILQNLEHYNQQRSDWNRDSLTGSLGIHTGSAHLGLVGESHILSPVLLSRNYGLAHHIQKLAGSFRTPILCSGSTLQAVKDRRSFFFRYMGMKKEAPVEPLYQVLPQPIPKIWSGVDDYRESFERSVFFLETGSYFEARRILKDLVQKFPQDVPLATLYQAAAAGEVRELQELPSAREN